MILFYMKTNIQMDALLQVRVGAGAGGDASSSAGDADIPAAAAQAAARAAVAQMKQELDKKNMSLAKAEEKCLVLEARQDDFSHLLQGFREDKVRVRRITTSARRGGVAHR